MLDAAIELTARGHTTPLFTTRCDPEATFHDVYSAGVDVRVRASSLPYDLSGRARVPCAMARMTALAAAARKEMGAVDVVLCDLVAQAVPFIRRAAQAPVAFYCHYPDRLLAPDGSATYGWYRRGIDALERRGFASSAAVFTNSLFTAGALHSVAPSLATTSVQVIAPGIDADRFASVAPLADGWSTAGELVLLSLGRFHKDKNHALAVEIIDTLCGRLGTDAASRVRLVIAGGYDDTLPESRALMTQLVADIASRGLSDRVTLARSPGDDEVVRLLNKASVVLHTAPAEHFGIAPIEAMAAGRPVVAVNHAGPAETIIDRQTGLLCEPTASAFADAVSLLIGNEPMAMAMGARGRVHAREQFSRHAFGDRLEAALLTIASRR